ncbi:thiamine phosphate synthase [Magnetospira sp. QH-2]|uniref:thiamine phosphate synthase n=1 Tax=Magnetospira sp. (strain QH-2) TaxID=1288970 RepID=UPI0003E8155A|nr:thiamine phosphate synthase [Magnetospira sp. QH-2]CCQ73297.1 Thiamine-phosphate pyrophosphorylase [Magnetospira sp. QH-2]
MTDSSCRLYLITPPRLEPEAFAPLLIETLDAGDVACLQLRLKDLVDDEIRRACDILRPLTQSRDVAFILNDRPDLAAECGCDGVHVGQDDWSYKKARTEVGDKAIVGVTCHDSRHLAMEAADAGADYVAFGAFYPTTTKDPKARAEPDLITWWMELMTVPCVAIGGITTDNARPLIEAGADFLAVSSGVWDHPEGPAAAIKAFNALV